MQVKYSKIEFGFGLLKSESVEFTDKTLKNSQVVRTKEKPGTDIPGLFGILFKYGSIAKEVVEFIEMFRNLLG
jgi:hypothetical protein